MNIETIEVKNKIHQLSKLYYSIGEVSNIFSVASSLLRYWESEFVPLKPKKNKNGERKYTIKDIQLIHSIYALTKEQGYTLEGAKQKLKQKKAPNSDHIKLLTDKLLNLKASIEKLKSK